MPTAGRLSFSSQLSILRSKGVWLAIMTVTFVFSAMFSSFSYIADYLSAITKLNTNDIRGLLMAFGVCGLVGNAIFSGLLQKNTVRTTILYPLFYILIFLLVWKYGHSAMIMCGLIVIWGAFYSSGLLISQTWLMRQASRAPEFANSLYISFSNLGITLGSLTGGWSAYFWNIVQAFPCDIVTRGLIKYPDTSPDSRSVRAGIRGRDYVRVSLISAQDLTINAG